MRASFSVAAAVGGGGGGRGVGVVVVLHPDPFLGLETIEWKSKPMRPAGLYKFASYPIHFAALVTICPAKRTQRAACDVPVGRFEEREAALFCSFM